MKLFKHFGMTLAAALWGAGGFWFAVANYPEKGLTAKPVLMILWLIGTVALAAAPIKTKSQLVDRLLGSLATLSAIGLVSVGAWKGGWALLGFLLFLAVFVLGLGVVAAIHAAIAPAPTAAPATAAVPAVVGTTP